MIKRDHKIDVKNILAIDAVDKDYGGRRVIDGLSLSVEAGQIVALLGPNGAGKSTTMKMCAGFVQPDRGTIHITGCDMAGDAAKVRRLITYLPEHVALYEELSGRENLLHLLEIGSGLRLDRQALDTALAAAGLPAEAFDRPASTYSKGMRQKVGLALAFSRRSALLLLDEPTSGLDPHSAADFNAALQRIAAQGIAVLMATHDIWRAREVASIILVMIKGRIAQALDPATLSAEEIERRFFLEAAT